MSVTSIKTTKKCPIKTWANGRTPQCGQIFFFQVAFKFVNPFDFKKLFLKFDKKETSETPCKITMGYENSNSISHRVLPHCEMVPSWYLFWIPSSYISFSLSIYPSPFFFSVFYVLRKNEAESNFSLLHTYRE